MLKPLGLLAAGMAVLLRGGTAYASAREAAAAAPVVLPKAAKNAMLLDYQPHSAQRPLVPISIRSRRRMRMLARNDRHPRTTATLRTGDPSVPHRDKSASQDPDDKVVNWNPPPKRDLVERALGDGTTDPKEIVAFAAEHKVKMSVEEVQAIIVELKKNSR